MSLASLTQFIHQAPDFEAVWQFPELQRLTNLRLPDAVTSVNEQVLRADASSMWLRWYLAGLSSPQRWTLDKSASEAAIYVEAISRAGSLFPNESANDKEAFAKIVARVLMQEVHRRRGTARTAPTRLIKQNLIAAATPPRCWMCGYAFRSDAISNFLGANKPPVSLVLPKIVDLFRPRGLIERDLQIEVDHIIPVAGGGGAGSNFALACGWCNSHKGARLSIYDTGVDPKPAAQGFVFSGTTLHELPRMFWTIRLLTVRQKCEHVGGCTATTQNHEMFVALRDLRGSPNPSNLGVYCAAHDPHVSERFVDESRARRIWGN
ncbi:MAG: HNH endonuclease [Burkholderiales bacterium]|nr:HNH endonuclease [Burkholderiales bacterium]